MLDKYILLIDIDGLRPDVLRSAVSAGKVPHIARLLGGQQMQRGLQIPALSSAPSSTFCAQASLFTGKHPKEHGIPGNQFLDRFGVFENGRPRRIGFDVGDIYAVDDALRVFSHSLASGRLQAPTIYQEFARKGYTSVVAGNMYGKGATTWLRPSLFKLGLMMKGMKPLKLSSAEYDRHVLDKLIDHIRTYGVSDITTMYFLGVDYESHEHGPGAQMAHLTQHIDPMIGELWEVIQAHAEDDKEVFVALFSDHGQVDVIPNDSCTLRIGSPLRQEMEQFFMALDRRVYRSPLDVLDNCDIYLGLNGGVCHVYARDPLRRWADMPDFEIDVLQMGRALWKAHLSGNHWEKLKGAVGGVLVRNVEHEGWDAPYRALTPEGQLVSLEEWFGSRPAYLYIDPVNRLNNLAGPMSGDLIVLPDYEAGYYFGEKHKGSHGGLHPDESRATLIYAAPDSTDAEWQAMQDAICQAITERCRTEDNRQPSVADMLVGVNAIVAPRPVYLSELLLS